MSWHASDAPPESRVFVQGVDLCNVLEVTAVMEEVGPLTMPFDKKGHFGFAHFHDAATAHKAVRMLQGRRVNGDTILHLSIAKSAKVATDPSGRSIYSKPDKFVPHLREFRDREPACRDPRSRYDSDAYPPRSRTGHSRSRSHSRSRERDFRRRRDESRFAADRSAGYQRTDRSSGGGGSCFSRENESERERTSSGHSQYHSGGSGLPYGTPEPPGSNSAYSATTHSQQHTHSDSSSNNYAESFEAARLPPPFIQPVATPSAPVNAARIFLVDASLRGYAEFMRGKLLSDAHIQAEIVLAAGISPVPRPGSRPEEMVPAIIPQPIEDARANGLRYLIAIGWREEKTMTLTLSTLQSPLIRDASVAAKHAIATVVQEEEIYHNPPLAPAVSLPVYTGPIVSSYDTRTIVYEHHDAAPQPLGYSHATGNGTGGGSHMLWGGSEVQQAVPSNGYSHDRYPPPPSHMLAYPQPSVAAPVSGMGGTSGSGGGGVSGDMGVDPRVRTSAFPQPAVSAVNGGIESTANDAPLTGSDLLGKLLAKLQATPAVSVGYSRSVGDYSMQR